VLETHTEAHARTPARPEARRAFRVAARIPLRTRRLSAEEAARREAELRSAPSAELELRDPAAAAWLARIEAKLDRLLVRMGEPGERPLGDADLQDVELSSRGLRVASREPIRPGDPVWVECLVPGTPARPVRALARAVRIVGEGGPAPAAALEFRVIAQRDRDALVRFTQDVQRCAAR